MGVEEASRGGADTLPPDDPQGSLKTEVAVAECFVLECVGADKQPFITTRK